MSLWLKTRIWERTSVRLNLSANLVTKVLAAVVSLACVPVYLRVLGISGYGLIGVWTTLETLANLLDFGVSPTITREMATSSAADGGGAQAARDLVRTLELAYWAVGLAIGGAIVLAASPIASYWLQSGPLPTGEVRSAVALIGILILCRWPMSFYSGGLMGLERQALLSSVGLAFACGRSFGAVFVLLFISPTISAFFIWQIAINLLQTAVLMAMLWRCLPAGRRAHFRPVSLHPVWKFASGVTGVALVSILLTDLDKIVVSKMLPLDDFGYYSLASRIAGTLSVASSPVITALFPAFVRFAATGDEQKLATLYHRGAQFMSALVLPAAATVLFFARPMIFAWTGNQAVADHTALVAALLTAGTALSCMVSVPFIAQLAYGWTSLAFWTNLISILVTIPLLLALTRRFGGPGAAAVWVAINATYFVTQVPIMHRKVLRHEAKRWYFGDVGIPLFACVTVAALLASATAGATTRAGAVLIACLGLALASCAGALAVRRVRKGPRDLVTNKHGR